MKRRYFTSALLKILLLFVLGVSIAGIGITGKVFAYYSSPYSYNSSRLGYPSNGYGLGMYSNIVSPFGFGGVYNLTSSLGGLYGTGLLGGLYGMGGLYGLGSLYSMYGLSGMYGLYGLGGLGSLYGGLNGLYGLGGLYGLSGIYGLNSLGGSGLLSLLSGIGGTASLSPLGINIPFAAEQAGTWIGTWNLGFLFGNMVMNLKEDLLGNLSGTAQLIGNGTFSGIFNVYGSGGTTFVILNGQDPTISYAIIIQGTITGGTVMNGFYDIYKVGSASPQETGTFTLELVTATVI